MYNAIHIHDNGNHDRQPLSIIVHERMPVLCKISDRPQPNNVLNG